jgi:uncharacterized protein YyaL (SSP411 family)
MRRKFNYLARYPKSARVIALRIAQRDDGENTLALSRMASPAIFDQAAFGCLRYAKDMPKPIAVAAQ